MSVLPEEIKRKIQKHYYESKVIKNISKNKPDIPYGDFGALRRYAKEPLVFYGNDMFKCIENYIEHMSHCDSFEKRHIIEALRSYEENLNGPLYQSFPFKEWLLHPVLGDIHSGASFGFCNAIIRQYYLYPEIFKKTWNKWIEKYC